MTDEVKVIILETLISSLEEKARELERQNICLRSVLNDIYPALADYVANLKDGEANNWGKVCSEAMTLLEVPVDGSYKYRMV